MRTSPHMMYGWYGYMNEPLSFCLQLQFRDILKLAEHEFVEKWLPLKCVTGHLHDVPFPAIHRPQGNPPSRWLLPFGFFLHLLLLFLDHLLREIPHEVLSKRLGEKPEQRHQIVVTPKCSHTPHTRTRVAETRSSQGPWGRLCHADVQG